VSRLLLRVLGSVLAAVVVAASPQLAAGQAEDPDPGRFAAEIARFGDWDKQNAFPDAGVVFVGSSSIRFWASAEDFPHLPVINRGFGGAHVSDVNHYIGETVLKYGPRAVVFYAGNNDIHAGKSVDQVLDDYETFVQRVGSASTRTQILFISIHPSLARWAGWGSMREANRRVEAYSASRPNLHYVDIASLMLGSDGEPIPEFFVEDGLHLSPAGYARWMEAVGPALDVLLSRSSEGE